MQFDYSFTRKMDIEEKLLDSYWNNQPFEFKKINSEVLTKGATMENDLEKQIRFLELENQKLSDSSEKLKHLVKELYHELFFYVDPETQSTALNNMPSEFLEGFAFRGVK